MMVSICQTTPQSVVAITCNSKFNSYRMLMLFSYHRFVYHLGHNSLLRNLLLHCAFVSVAFHSFTTRSILLQAIPSFYKPFHPFTTHSILLQPIPSFYNPFHPFTTHSILLQPIPSFYNPFHPFTTHSILLQPIPSFYNPFHPFTTHSILLQPIP